MPDLNTNRIAVQDLCVDFRIGGQFVTVAGPLSFCVPPGRILALVGESGCGKSVSCLALARLIAPPQGRVRAKSILLADRHGQIQLAEASDRRLRQVRGSRIAYIFQEPSVSLNPVFRVGAQIEEVLALHRPEIRNRAAAAAELLGQVGIPSPAERANAFPHELSGGMLQRVMIAMALAGHPGLLIADEPTTALDVTVQSQILELIDRLRRERKMSVILVTHNLGIVSEIADEVAVMYAGLIVEQISGREFFRELVHPYSQALLRAVPRLGAGGKARLEGIAGTVPPPENFPVGCRFFGRCARAETLSAEERARCMGNLPELRELHPGHWCRCFFAERRGQ
ncbi:MAG: ABC transporter ATP-binding protein [Victivallaceae bacterium]|nr:ABC transporter ATP-binding protein [Victivallaceae bacterium]